MGKILGIGGIFFKSKDPNKLAEWYKKNLGMELDSTFTGSVFKHSASSPEAYTVWSPFNEDTEYFKPSGKGFMINFIVDDLEETLGVCRI